MPEFKYAKSLYTQRHPECTEQSFPPNTLKELVKLDIGDSKEVELLYLRNEALTELYNTVELLQATLRYEMYARNLLSMPVFKKDPRFDCLSDEEILKLWRNEKVSL